MQWLFIISFFKEIKLYIFLSCKEIYLQRLQKLFISLRSFHKNFLAKNENSLENGSLDSLKFETLNIIGMNYDVKLKVFY